VSHFHGTGQFDSFTGRTSGYSNSFIVMRDLD
jgi:hypothetical protein